MHVAKGVCTWLGGWASSAQEKEVLLWGLGPGFFSFLVPSVAEMAMVILEVCSNSDLLL